MVATKLAEYLRSSGKMPDMSNTDIYRIIAMDDIYGVIRSGLSLAKHPAIAPFLQKGMEYVKNYLFDKLGMNSTPKAVAAITSPPITQTNYFPDSVPFQG